eukprot:gb/GECH01010073.1/.p1 GENE.gb/GECH01010073.1/~~gb/GECH01010073.1/.p1  ORF type:complete len:1568 (+),score=218.06 gb/GECH01010073.1/:1-4704(+)
MNTSSGDSHSTTPPKTPPPSKSASSSGSPVPNESSGDESPSIPTTDAVLLSFDSPSSSPVATAEHEAASFLSNTVDALAEPGGNNSGKEDNKEEKHSYSKGNESVFNSKSSKKHKKTKSKRTTHFIVKTVYGDWYIVSSLGHRNDSMVINIDRHTGTLVYTGQPGIDLFKEPRDALDYISPRRNMIQSILKCTAIIGMVTVGATLNLLIVTKSTPTATLPGGHDVHNIDSTKWVQIELDYPYDIDREERKNLELLREFPIEGLHFYCDTLDITRRFPSSSDIFGFEPEFVWNEFLAQPFTHIGLRSVCCVLLEGLCVEKSVPVASGGNLHLCLVTRKSSLNPGTRYFARGFNDRISPGNEYECELLMWTERSKSELEWTSYVWRRGTVPMFWSAQITSAVSDAEVEISDRPYEKLDQYYRRLQQRYGDYPLLLVNLLRHTTHKDESVLSQHFKESLSVLKRMMKIDVEMFNLDWLNAKKQNGLDYAVQHLWSNIKSHLQRSGVTKGVLSVDGDHVTSSSLQSQQTGILRFNCADSLDRTNLSTFFMCLQVIAEQSRILGTSLCTDNTPSSRPWPLINSNLETVKYRLSEEAAVALAEVFVLNGDVCATLFTNSPAMHTDVMREFAPHMPAAPMNAKIIVQRRFTNVFEDKHRQCQYEMFVGINSSTYFPHSYPNDGVQRPQIRCVSHVPPTFLFKSVPNQMKEMLLRDEHCLLRSVPGRYCWICPQDHDFVQLNVFLPYFCRVTEFSIVVRHGEQDTTSPSKLDAFVGTHLDDAIMGFQSLQLPRCEDGTRLLYTFSSQISGIPDNFRLYNFEGTKSNYAMRVVSLTFHGIPPSSCMTLGDIHIFGHLHPDAHNPINKCRPQPTQHLISGSGEGNLIDLNSPGNNNDSKRNEPNDCDLPSGLEVLEWLTNVARVPLPRNKDLVAAVKDGALLCRFMTKITGKNISYEPRPKGRLDYEQSNIQKFLNECVGIGIPSSELFSPGDLLRLSGTASSRVVRTLVQVDRRAQGLDTFSGPYLISNPDVGTSNNNKDRSAIYPLASRKRTSNYVGRRDSQVRRQLEINKVKYMEQVKLYAAQMTFTNALKLEHLRLNLGLSCKDRDDALVRGGYKVARFDPNRYVWRRDEKVESAIRKRRKTNRCHRTGQSIKLRKSSCRYCRYSFSRSCMAPTKTPIIEFMWDTPQNVCLECYDNIEEQKNLLSKIKSMSYAAEQSAQEEQESGYYQKMCSRVFPPPDIDRKYESFCQGEMSLASFPSAGILSSVTTDTEAGSTPIESILFPEDLASSEDSHWFSCIGELSVNIIVVLPSYARVQKIAIVADRWGYRGFDAPDIHISVAEQLPVFSSVGDWNISHSGASGEDTIVAPGQKIEYPMDYKGRVRLISLNVTLPWLEGESANKYSEIRRLHLGRLLVFGTPDKVTDPFSQLPKAAKEEYDTIMTIPSKIDRHLIRSEMQKFIREQNTLDISIDDANQFLSGFIVDIKHGTEGPSSQVKSIRVSLLMGSENETDVANHEVVGEFVIPKVAPGTVLTYEFGQLFTHPRVARFEFLSNHGGKELITGRVSLFYSVNNI